MPPARAMGAASATRSVWLFAAARIVEAQTPAGVDRDGAAGGKPRQDPRSAQSQRSAGNCHGAGVGIGGLPESACPAHEGQASAAGHDSAKTSSVWRLGISMVFVLPVCLARDALPVNVRGLFPVNATVLLLNAIGLPSVTPPARSRLERTRL